MRDRQILNLRLKGLFLYKNAQVKIHMSTVLRQWRNESALVVWKQYAPLQRAKSNRTLSGVNPGLSFFCSYLILFKLPLGVEKPPIKP